MKGGLSLCLKSNATVQARAVPYGKQMKRPKESASPKEPVFRQVNSLKKIDIKDEKPKRDIIIPNTEFTRKKHSVSNNIEIECFFFFVCFAHWRTHFVCSSLHIYFFINYIFWSIFCFIINSSYIF